MKSQLLFLFLVLTQILSAQIFTEVSGTPFKDVEESSIAFSDVDGDGDDDVLITGQTDWNSSFELIAVLYTNDGGSFTEVMGTPFDGVKFGSIAFSDVDGDGDNDLLITGRNNSIELIAKLYTNDGGSFTEVTGTPFEAVWYSSVAFSDVDGDGDDDLLITGRNGVTDQNGNFDPIAKLYTNDGGNFTEVENTLFDGAWRSSIAFSDVDGDGDDDLLITGGTGWSGLYLPIAKLYINDGAGSFAEDTGTPFDGVERSSIAFSDVDGDGDNDLLITGNKVSVGRIAKLYINDGAGNFTEVPGTPFDGVKDSSVAFSDVDGDGDNDVLIAGQTASIDIISKLYTNDGGGSFTEVTDTPIGGVLFGSVAFSDVDGDGSKDLLVTGLTPMYGTALPSTKLYSNNEMVSSTDELTIGYSLEFLPFPNPTSSSTLFIQYHAAEMGEATIKVYHVNGVLLQQQDEFVVGGQQVFPIDMTALRTGTYLVELNIGNKKGSAKFFVH